MAYKFGRQRGVDLCEPTLSKKRVLGQPQLHREILSQKEKQLKFHCKKYTKDGEIKTI